MARRSVTYAAIRTAVLDQKPEILLDLGCGEGWLCRELTGEGVACIGVDASAPLVELAREAGGGDFIRLSYEQICRNPAQLGVTPDVVVANFSLLDEQAPDLLQAIATISHEATRLIIQTTHPHIAGPASRSGWKMELFKEHDGDGWRQMPWYFRNFGDWTKAVAPHWQIDRVEEPRETGIAAPSSLLIVCSLQR